MASSKIPSPSVIGNNLIVLQAAIGDTTNVKVTVKLTNKKHSVLVMSGGSGIFGMVDGVHGFDGYGSPGTTVDHDDKYITLTFPGYAGVVQFISSFPFDITAPFA